MTQMVTERLETSKKEYNNSISRAAEILKNGGYEFVKVSDLIYKEDYTIDHTGRQFCLQ